MKLSDLIDCIILFFTLFILSATLFRQSSIGKQAAILFAVALSVAITFFYANRKIKKRKAYCKDKAEEKQYDQISAQLKVNDYNANKELMEKIFENERGMTLFFSFTFEPISADKCIDFYKKTKNGKTVIVCSTASEQAKSVCRTLSERIRLIEDKELFLMMKKINIFPEITIILQDKKESFLKTIKKAFSKQNAKKMLITGIILILTSYFSLFPIYYIFIGTILCTIGVTIKFFGIKKA